ncbi:hypothetical protein QWJ34_02810 [Saccharibacillus sp. CPCC 101409]|uniref:hypothetical protein n=1 Tax=Saccharibacillus sp. CPCC 101409 TaxID=3058041 RepID=UPI002672788C|nr:hypothetical protein [Saccharibacillus sp. CPCC 101409]MDO3408690.1 hypothetical protein [Saccharibacillus sp. CPCC 101409]
MNIYSHLEEKKDKRKNRFRGGVGRLAGLLLVLLLLGTAVLPAGRSEAAETEIDAAKAKSISRLSFPIRDDKKHLYRIYIFASDEKKSVTTQDDAWAGASPGDVIYSGSYRAALVKNGRKTGVVQKVNLNLRTINTTRNESFRLQGDGKSRPDLLFLSQAAASNVNEIYGFVITGGTLHSLDFASETGVSRGRDGYAAPKEAMRGLSGNRIQTRFYNNATWNYSFDTYKLDIKSLQLRHVGSVSRPDYEWPNV